MFYVQYVVPLHLLGVLRSGAGAGRVAVLARDTRPTKVAAEYEDVCVRMTKIGREVSDLIIAATARHAVL